MVDVAEEGVIVKGEGEAAAAVVLRRASLLRTAGLTEDSCPALRSAVR